jgi:hypothetical protein
MRPWFLVAALLFVVVGVLLACERADRYIYTAQKFDPAAGCLGAYEPIEAVTGSGVSATCAPTCLLVDGELYLSTLCPPVPTIAEEVPAADEACRAAIAAASGDASCEAPGEEGDGGPDEAGGEDAAEEAPPPPPEDAAGGD